MAVATVSAEDPAKRRSATSVMMGVPRPRIRACSSRAGVPPLNSRPPIKPAAANEPFKHVIDEYKHQAQTITCTCGWHGSSATIDRAGSEWTAHLIEVRGKKR